MAQALDGTRERAQDVTQAAGLGEGDGFGCDEKDVHLGLD
jgi:hypothetical protein